MILITHDRSLMELVADRLWLAADGTVTPFDGDMADYANLILGRATASVAKDRGKQKAGRSPRASMSRGSPLEDAELGLENATRKVARLEGLLAEAAGAAYDHERLVWLEQEVALAKTQLAEVEEAWLAAAGSAGL